MAAPDGNDVSPEVNKVLAFFKQLTPTQIAIILVGMVVAIFFLIPDAVFEKYDRWSRPEYYEQHDKFHAQHKFVKEVISEWNTVRDISDTIKKNVIAVRNGHKDSLEGYRTLKVDKLSLSTQITWHYHLAKLFIIDADITDKISSVDDAITNLQRVEELRSKGHLTPEDITFLGNIRILRKVNRTYLNAHALGYLISKANNDQSTAENHLNQVEFRIKDLGGCTDLRTTEVYHLKLREGIGCWNGKTGKS